MKKAALVSTYFLPSPLAGVHRVRFMANHLKKFGWEPHVFCADEQYHEGDLDIESEKLLSEDVSVYKVPAISPKWTRPFGMGDMAIRSHHSMRKALFDFFKNGGNLIYVTVLPGYTMLLGPKVKRKFNVPFVLDYQDPWVSKWGATQPRLSKAGINHWLATKLEPKVLPYTDHITAVSAGTNDEIRERHPDLSEDHFSVFPIGGDGADFDYLKQNPRTTSVLDQSKGKFIISYVGTVWDKVMPTLRNFFSALQKAKEKQSNLGEKLAVHFVGTGVTDEPNVIPTAKEFDLTDIVHETPKRIPFLDATDVMVRSDCVLAIGSDEPHYTASKIFPLLLSRRPIVAFYHSQSSVCEMLKDAAGTTLIPFDEKSPLNEKTNEIAEMILQFVDNGRPDDTPPREDPIQPFLAESIAEGYAKIFDRLITVK